MKKSNPILSGFKGSSLQEVKKSILNPNKLDHSKYDIFSDGQIKEYLKSVITKNEGMALEIQKSVVANVKSEISRLIPIDIMHNRVAKKFYISKAGACVELSKAMEPVNKKEGYFDNEINEDEVLKFIDENSEVDDEILIEKFGEDVTEILNSLENEGKLDVDDDGYYFVTEDNEEESVEGNENEEGEEEKEEENFEKEESAEKVPAEEEFSEENKEENIDNNEGEEENEEEVNSAGGGIQEISFEEEENLGNEIPNKEENINNNETEEENIENTEIADNEEVENENKENLNNSEEDLNNNFENSEENNEASEEGNKENNEIINQEFEGEMNGEKPQMSPEELEAFAKKTATVTLLKFYKNSTDEQLKEIAAIELKSRGVDVNNGEVEQKGNENGDLPENKAALDALEKFTKDYLGKYDNEDLISVVVELANQDPGKRRELKDLYRNFYSMTNNGNKLLKVDEEEFKGFLTDHYFNNFTPGDLQSYAYLLISKNPKEYRKYKKMMDLENEPII